MRQKPWLVPAFFLCLLLWGCGSTAGEQSTPAASAAQHISEYMAAHPYFNPYNTLTDCDDEYIYCVQSQSKDIQAGIYRRRISGGEWELIYENDETPVETVSEDGGSRASVIPGITSAAVYEDHIYFARLAKIYRIGKDGSGLIKTGFSYRPDAGYPFSANVPYPYTLRVVGDILYAGYDGRFAAFDLSADAELNAGCEDAPSNHQGCSGMPWSAPLPGDWILSAEDGLALVSPAGKRLPVSDGSSAVLVDYSALCAVQVIPAEGAEDGYYYAGMFPLTESDSTDAPRYTLCIRSKCDADAALPHSVQWCNLWQGMLYGCCGKNLYACDILTGEVLTAAFPEGLTLIQSGQPIIDAVGSLVFFRCSDRIVYCWNTADGSINAVG